MLIPYLTSELTQLSTEAKKKNENVKTLADDFIVWLKDKQESNIVQELLNYNTHALTAAMESKNVKLVIYALNIYLKLISYKAIGSNDSENLIKYLNELKDSEKDLQLKVLQVILPLVVNQDISSTLLVDLIMLCYKLQDTKAPVVNNTAEATFRQLVILVFEKVLNKPTEQVYKEDADIYALTAKETTILLKITDFDKGFGLELIEGILNSCYKLFKEENQLLGVLKDKICALIIKFFSEKLDYSVMVRLTRLSMVIIKHFHQVLPVESEILLSLESKIAEMEGSLYSQKIITLEALKNVFNDGNLTRSIYKTFDGRNHAAHALKDAVHSLSNIIFTEKNALMEFKSLTVDQKDLKENLSQVEYAFNWGDSQVKVLCIDQLEKVEIPNISDSYHIYLAIQGLLSLAENVISFVMQKNMESADPTLFETRNDDVLLAIEMINCTGPNILASFTILLFSNIDDETFNLVLDAFQYFAITIGLLGLVPLRDAFIACLCKLSIPCGTVLNMDMTTLYREFTNLNVDLPAYFSQKHHLNERNVSASKALIKVGHSLQSVLDNRAWYGIIETFQIIDNLVFVGKVEKKQSVVTPGVENLYFQLCVQIKSIFAKSNEMSMRELSEFVRALCQLSQEIAMGASLNPALTSHTTRDSMKVAEEKSFAISKLLEVSLCNLSRLLNAGIETESKSGSTVSPPIVDIWEMIIGQLIEVSHTPASSPSIRSQACAAFGEILIHAIQVADFSNPKIETRIINPIKSLILVEALSPVVDSSDERIIRYLWLLDVQKSALDTLYKILQAGGQKINSSWLIIFEIFQGVLLLSKRKRPKIDNLHVQEATPTSDQVNGKIIPLVRLSFPSIQLICSDFLSILNPDVLAKCIETVSVFGSQKDDLNISLSSVRLLWSMSDYILGKKVELDKTSSEKNVATPDSELSLGSLWMLLLSNLSQLCSDERPEVRNSANQSLFGCINMNGKKLVLEEWDEFIWNILFPLLEKIKEESAASLLIKQPELTPGSSPIHHARNTPSKQWDETKVLTLNGTSKIFIDYMYLLVNLPSRFEKVWMTFLEFIKESCVECSTEVSLAAAKSLKALMQYPKAFNESKPIPDSVQDHLVSLWLTAWRVWCSIGFGIVLTCGEYEGISMIYLQDVSLPYGMISQGPRTQEVFVVLINLFSDIYDVVHSKLGLEDFQLLFRILILLLLYHPIASNNPADKFKTLIISDADQASPLQQAIIDIQIRVEDHINSLSEGTELFIIFLSNCASLPFIKQKSKVFIEGRTFTYDAFSKKSFQILEENLSRNIDSTSLYTSGAFNCALDAFHQPLLRKYDTSYVVKDQPPIWKYAIQSFINITKQALDTLNSKIAVFGSDDLNSIYLKIIQNFEVFLLSTSKPDSSISEEELKNDESQDIRCLDSLVKDLLIYFGKDHVHDEILERILKLIYEGTKLYTRPIELNNPNISNDLKYPVKYSYSDIMNGSLKGFCLGNDVVPVTRKLYGFHSLDLLFSLCSDKVLGVNQTNPRISKMAGPLMIQKCESVFLSYIADRSLCGKMPMPQNEELSHILSLLLGMSMLPASIGVLSDRFPPNAPWIKSQKSHMFILFPRLIDLLSVLAGPSWLSDDLGSDVALVNLTRDCLGKISSELSIS